MLQVANVMTRNTKYEEKRFLLGEDKEKHKIHDEDEEVDNRVNAEDQIDWLKEVLGFLLCVGGCAFAAFGTVCVKKLNGLVPDIEVGEI